MSVTPEVRCSRAFCNIKIVAVLACVTRTHTQTSPPLAARPVSHLSALWYGCRRAHVCNDVVAFPAPCVGLTQAQYMQKNDESISCSKSTKKVRDAWHHKANKLHKSDKRHNIAQVCVLQKHSISSITCASAQQPLQLTCVLPCLLL